MTNLRARLLGTFACLLLALPLLPAGCGEPPPSAGPDAHGVAPGDAASGALEDASGAGADASATPDDAGDTELPDAGLASADASLETADVGEPIPADAGASADDDAGAVTAADAGSAGDDAGAVTCPRLPRDPDRPRKVVLAHPFSSTTPDHKSNVWDVLDLSTTGAITEPMPRVSVTMGRGMDTEVVFTPDGLIALAPQDDGTIGELQFDEAGAVTVLQTGWDGGFWCDRIVMDPSGERFYAIDGEWPDIGGGIYSVRIGCDGSLTNEGRVLSAKNPAAFAYLPGRAPQVFLFGKEVLGATPLANAHLLDWSGTPALVASAVAFPDDDAIVSDARVMPDGQWALISDNSAFGTHRVGVVELQQGAVRAVQVLTPFNDPAQVVPSPYGNAALVVSAEGNHFHVLSFDPSQPNAPFAIVGPVAYLGGARPQLPLVAVALQQGALFGRVYVAELEGIRSLQFEPDGGVTDLGLTSFLSDFEAITGSMGIQP